MSALGYHYPAGAEHDPRAPWNQETAEPCEKCDGKGKSVCPHCRHGFAPDYSHPTEMRLKSCDECGGTGQIECDDCNGTGEGETPSEARQRHEEDKADMDRDAEIDRRDDQ